MTTHNFESQDGAVIAVDESPLVTISTTIESVVVIEASPPKGDQGEAAAIDISIPTDSAIASGKVIALNSSGFAIYANNATIYKNIVGISVASVNAGTNVLVRSYSELSNLTWNWDITKRLFLGLNGVITQTPPSDGTGVIIPLGFVKTPTTIFIRIGETSIAKSIGVSDAGKTPALNNSGFLDSTIINSKTISTGVSDAGKIAALDDTGRLDITVMPAGLGPDIVILTTSEALSAGDFVNVWNSVGAKVRKANATTSGKEAHGFVLLNYNLGDSAIVYFEGTNTSVIDQTPGIAYLSTTAGLATATPPSAFGNIIQRIGFTVSATAINFQANNVTAPTATRNTLLSVTSGKVASSIYSTTSHGTGYIKYFDSGGLGVSAAVFNAACSIAIFLNGVYQFKGIDVIWQSSTSFQLNTAVDNGDEIIILS